jgi:glycosyltransferase involved in cell wall biosynthesis
MFVANKIISNGHDTKIFYEQLLERHVEAIPNAIEVKKYSLISRKAFSNQQITIAYIGRLSDEKGIRAFMQSIVLYNATINIGNLNFEIVGDGPLSYLVEKFQVDTPNVTYLGPIANSDMLSYLSRIDVGVCLTFSGEIGGGGVSNGLLELLASKRLAITWDSDIFRQVVSDDSSYLVKENDVKCLAECYLMLSKDSAQFNRRIEHGFQVVQLYSFDSHIEKYLNYVYT